METFKNMGKTLDFLNVKRVYAIFIPLYIVGIVVYFYKSQIPLHLLSVLPEVFALIGLVFVFKVVF